MLICATDDLTTPSLPWRLRNARWHWTLWDLNYSWL